MTDSLSFKNLLSHSVRVGCMITLVTGLWISTNQVHAEYQVTSIGLGGASAAIDLSLFGDNIYLTHNQSTGPLSQVNFLSNSIVNQTSFANNTYPAFSTVLNNKLYFTNKGNATVSVFNNLGLLESTINVGNGPESIVGLNNKIYVANTSDNTISIRDTSNNTTSTLSVPGGPNDPTRLRILNNKVYVVNTNTGIVYSISNSDVIENIFYASGTINDIELLNNKLYMSVVSLTGSSNIKIFSGTTLESTIPGGNMGFNNIINTNNRLYISNSISGNILAISGSTIESTWNVRGAPSEMTVYNNRLYVSNNSGINTINLSNNTTGFISIAEPSFIKIKNVANRIYAIGSNGSSLYGITNMPTINSGNTTLLTGISVSITLSGTAESGSTVSLIKPNNTVQGGNTIATSNDTRSINLSGLTPGIYNLRPRANLFGYTETGSTTTLSIVGGYLNYPITNTILTNTGLILSGVATSGSNVRFIINGVLNPNSTVADSNNTFRYGPTNFFPSTGTYVIQPIIELGSTIYTGSSITVQFVNPPIIPTISYPTNNSTILYGSTTITGSATSGTSVSLSINGVIIASGIIANSSHVYSYTTSLPIGSYPLQVVGYYYDAITTGSTNTISVFGAPTLNSPNQGADVLSGNIIFSGNALSGSLVNIYHTNGNFIASGVANNSNVFNIGPITPTRSLGTYSVYATSTLGSSVATGVMRTFNVVNQIINRVPSIISPINNSTTTNPISFYGNGYPGDVINILNSVGVSVTSTIVNSNGTYTTPTLSLPSGIYKVRSSNGLSTYDGNSIYITINNPTNQSKDYCPNGDFSNSYYDNNCGSPVIVDDADYNNLDFPKGDVLEDICVPYEDDDYSLSMYDALKLYRKHTFVICWMRSHGLTKHTKQGYYRGNDGLRRDESAKFMYQYLTEVLGISAEKKNTFCNYQDLYKYNSDLKSYITKSCESGILKGTTTNKSFNPRQYVSKKNFTSMISNLITTYEPNGDNDTSLLDDINELSKSSSAKVTRLDAAHALYKLSQVIQTTNYISTNNIDDLI